MSDSKDEMRAAAMFEAECATGGGDTISRALHRRELSEKDATIKALADVLWDHGDVYGEDGWHRYGCPLADVSGGNCGERCKTDRAALRLAGRLP